MAFLGWLFIIFGLLEMFIMPLFGVLSVVVGFILISLSRNLKRGHLKYTANKLRLKAKKLEEKGLVDKAQKLYLRAEKYEAKARKYE